MSDNQGSDPNEISQVFLKHLEDTGFFQQIKDLEGNLTTIAGELQKFGEAANSRMEETENLAAHILAIESVLAAMLKSAGVSLDDVRAEVKERTAAISGNEDGSPTVHHIAEDMVKRASGA